MIFSSILVNYLLILSLALKGVLTTHVNVFGGKIQELELRGEGDTNPYLIIIKGLLRSDKIVRYASDIPCNIIQTLESDAGQAQQLVQQIEDGQVPTIIQNLPSEVISAFSDVVGIFVTLPSQLVGAAEAAVTDAANIFNDIETGAIVSDIEALPNIVVSDVTSAWGDLTSGLEDDWNAATDAIACFFDACPVTSSAVDSCGNGTTSIASDQVASLASVQSVAQASVTVQSGFQASVEAQGSFVATVAPAAPVSLVTPVVTPTGTGTITGAGGSSASGVNTANVVSSKAAGGSGVLETLKGVRGVHFWGIAMLAVFGLALWL